jgi:hypothetical protein
MHSYIENMLKGLEDSFNISVKDVLAQDPLEIGMGLGEIESAEEIIERVNEKFFEHYGDALRAAIRKSIRDNAEIPIEFGDNLTVEQMAQRLTQAQGILSKVDEFVRHSEMSEQEIAVERVNQKYDQMKQQLQSLGVAVEDTNLAQARAIELEQARAQQYSQAQEIISGIDRFVRHDSMTEQEIAIERVNQKYDQMEGQLEALGVAVEDTNLSQARAIELEEVRAKYIDQTAEDIEEAISSLDQAKLKTQFEDIFGEASLGTQIEAAGIAGTDLESILQGLPEGLEASTEAAREYGHQILDSAKNTENAQAALDIFSKVLAEIADDLENLKQMKGTGVNIREILGLDFVPRYLKQSILGENADLGLNWDQKTGEGLIDNFNRLNELLKEGTIESQEYSSFMSHFIDKEQELSQARKSSIDSIDSLLQRLKGSELSPVQSMEHYEQRYENLLGRAEESRGTAGFADAISDLTSFVPEMLEYAGAYGGNYKELYNSVMQTIENMRPVDQGMMRPIDEGRTDTGQGFVSSTVYTQRLADYYNRIGYDYQGVTDWTPFKVLDAIKTTGMSLEEHASKYLSRDSFKDKLGLPLYASGGYHDGGWRVVGERGPELEFTQPSSIVSSKESKKMLQEAVAEGLAAAGGSGNGDVVVKVYVGTNELKDYHVEWHRSDEETHEAVRREAR